MSEHYISERIPVPAAFDKVFTHFYKAANNSNEAVRKTLLPSYQTIMVFSFGTPVSFTSQQQTSITPDNCLVIGPIKQPIDYTLPAGAEILVANFKADAFYRFFGQALIIATHPDELLGETCFSKLWSQLKDISTATGRVQYILDFCEPYLRDSDNLSERITQMMPEATVVNPVKIVARETQQSERSVQMKHKAQFGYSVKEITRYQRFLKAIELVQQQATEAKKVDWFDIVHECGYYDQSQLINDFKHYVHLSPTQFLKFQEDICMAG
ncbi:MAG: helix-turn-helix domain-containing protein [Chitinophagaceae bacterium]